MATGSMRRKFPEDWPCRLWDMWADRQTDRHAHCTTSHLYLGWSKKSQFDKDVPSLNVLAKCANGADIRESTGVVVYSTVFYIFTAWCRAGVVHAIDVCVSVCLSVRLSVCLSQVGALLKRLNLDYFTICHVYTSLLWHCSTFSS